MKMFVYTYSAIDSTGASRRGDVQASTEQDAFRKLRAAGLTPLAIRQRLARGPVFSFQRIKSEDICALTRELAVLIEAKIPLDRGLISIAEHDGKSEVTAMVRDIATQIESGKQLTAALATYKQYFGDVYIETIRAGESSGNLSAVMSHLAELLEKQAEAKQQLRRAMMYPIIVMCMVAVAVTVIVVFVVPKFAATFSASGAEMPLMTRVIQTIGDSVRHWWWGYTGALLSAVVTVAAMWRSRGGRVLLEALIARTPYIGRIVIAMTAGQFSRVVSIALASGLDVIDALRIAGRASGRPIFMADCESMADRMSRGESLAEVLRVSRYLPSFARRMIGAGKDSREVAKSCDIIARHYDREAGHLTKNINTIVEPLLTVAMAAIVLVVALAVFLPMWKMASLHH